ncbi:PAS domain S-box protein [Methylobacter sp.]|uniref:PAS domain S-box protein n=1 Tax=Methylobacter sp. TaxID=2051955 RepID=UPI0025EEA750|nr:PAS domain S-box protein [Methylobacter sp.]
MQPLIDFFDINEFTPHGYCLSWKPALLWLHVISDLLTTLAYYSIPLILVYFIRQRKDFPYPWLTIMFAGFIVACGTTHLLSAITIWTPLYWLDGLVKALTAIVSVITAVMMLWVIPGALSLPSVAQLQAEIQKRKTVEDALRENEYRWKFAVHGSGDGVWDWDMQTNETMYSNRWKEMLGYAENDILPNLQEWINLIHPDDQPLVTEAAQAYLNGKTAIYVVEYRLRCKDESYKWVLSRGMVVSRSEDGKPLRMIGTHKDISVRKKAEEALRQSQAALQEAQRIAHVGSWQLDLTTNHVVWSEELYRILGMNPELQPPDCTEYHRLFTSESWKRLNAILAHTQETGRSYELELEIIRTNGTHGWILARGEAIRDSNEAIIGLHGVALDITERKQMEKKLRDSDAFNLSILNSLTSNIAVLDAQGIIVEINNAWRRFAKENGLPQSYQNMLGTNYLDACNKDYEATAAKEGIAAVLAGELETFHLEYSCHLPNQQRWFHMNVSPLQGSRHGVVISHENITERKLMEEELKASETKFRSIIDASPVPMALNDEQSNITFLNPAFIQTFGYNINDIPTLADWFPKAYPDPDYRHRVETTWQASLEKAKQEHTDFPPLELTIRCKNNSIKTALVSAAAIQPGFAGEHLVILYDITRRKQIEAKLNAIFNASVEGIITYGKDDIIVSANAAVETIFGYKPEELIGYSICAIMPSCCSLSQTEKLAGQIGEIEGLRKDGSVVPLDLSVAEYSINDTHYFTSIVRDVSLRKHREQQDKEHLDELAHVTRLGLMGEMASGIAHEVNQPLAAISSYTQVSLNLINTENPDLVQLTEILSKTQQQALRAGRIIHRMREFVKSHAKHRSTADINVLIHEAVGLCMADLKQNSIKLTFELEKNLPPIYVDQIQIEQVIMNLIRNSIETLQNKPAKQQPQINIHSQLTSDNNILVMVKDNGQGLDEGQQQQILTPFYTTKANGMGMGLSISRSIIEAHEGALHFNSQPGKGASFYFTLPTQRKPDEP